MNANNQIRQDCFRASRFEFPLGQRTYLVGILNVTPDSFSDGGRFITIDQAQRHAEEMILAGVDIIDIGGESTRPGNFPVELEEELQRVIPVIEKVCKTFDCAVSIDTYKAAVADAALSAGACIINDINGLQQDLEMASVAAHHNAGVIIMHNARLYRGVPPEASPSADIISDVVSFLQKSCMIARQAGVQSDHIMIDPGIGFGVTSSESIEMIARLEELKQLGYPILIGPSRKRFIGNILNQTAADRLHGTSAAVAIGIDNGADFIRVHDVREMAEVARVADALSRRLVLTGGRQMLDDHCDQILMNGMVFHGHVGVLAAEKLNGQLFQVDIILHCPRLAACETDQLYETIDYSAAYTLVKKVVETADFDLIERLAGQIASTLLDHFALAAAVDVTVQKPQAPIDGQFKAMGIHIYRESSCLI